MKFIYHIITITLFLSIAVFSSDINEPEFKKPATKSPIKKRVTTKGDNILDLVDWADEEKIDESIHVINATISYNNNLIDQIEQEEKLLVEKEGVNNYQRISKEGLKIEGKLDKDNKIHRIVVAIFDDFLLAQPCVLNGRLKYFIDEAKIPLTLTDKTIKKIKKLIIHIIRGDKRELIAKFPYALKAGTYNIVRKAIASLFGNICPSDLRNMSKKDNVYDYNKDKLRIYFPRVFSIKKNNN